MRRKSRIITVIPARRYDAEHAFVLPGVRELPRERQLEDDRVW